MTWTRFCTKRSWKKLISLQARLFYNFEYAGCTQRAFFWLTERLNVQIISTTQKHNPYLLSKEQEKEMIKQMEKNKSYLKVPRRPSWTTEMTAQELQHNERTAFLEWRRELAQ